MSEFNPDLPDVFDPSKPEPSPPTGMAGPGELAGAPAAPPPDAFAPEGWTAADYADVAEEIGMDAGELQAIYAPAREAVQLFGSQALIGLFDSVSVNGQPLGSHPELLRAVGKIGTEVRSMRQQLQRLGRENAELRGRLNQPTAPRQGPGGEPTTLQDLDGRYSTLFTQWREADASGRFADAAKLAQQMETINKSRFDTGKRGRR